jgi:uncharacterized protein YheU (UPF0270 family)
MSRFVEVPPARLEPGVLQALLEEYASRDGTDYGERELSLAQKEGELRRQLSDGALMLLYDTETETWDLLERDRAQALLDAGLNA